jgi:hypothetical protein
MKPLKLLEDSLRVLLLETNAVVPNVDVGLSSNAPLADLNV